MAIYLFSQIFKFTKHIIKLIEKLSRRHLINSSDVFLIKGFTVTNYGRRHSKLFTNAMFRETPCISTIINIIETNQI